jgi:hypothetical protein
MCGCGSTPKQTGNDTYSLTAHTNFGFDVAAKNSAIEGATKLCVDIGDRLQLHAFAELPTLGTVRLRVDIDPPRPSHTPARRRNGPRWASVSGAASCSVNTSVGKAMCIALQRLIRSWQSCHPARGPSHRSSARAPRYRYAGFSPGRAWLLATFVGSRDLRRSGRLTAQHMQKDRPPRGGLSNGKGPRPSLRCLILLNGSRCLSDHI